MARRSLERRLAALERARTPIGGAFVVDIGDEETGECLQLDEWQRRYPGAIVVDIGGAGTNDDQKRDV